MSEVEGQLSDEQIDSTYDSLLGDAPVAEAEEIAPEQVVKAPVEQTIKFTHNGKEIIAPVSDPRVTQWIQQGYDYNTQMQAFKQQRSDFEKTQKQIEELKNQYGPVDEWVKANPDQWQKFVQQYEQSQRGLTGEIDLNNPLVRTIQQLEQKIGQLEQPFKEIVDERTKAKIEASEKALDAEIESVKQEFGLDLKTAESDGRSKELKVYEHAAKIGTRSFRTAFLDLYHKDLLKSAEDRGRESIQKERQKQTKLGLLGKSSAPSKELKAAKDYKNKTYDQLLQEGVDELGLDVG